MDIRYEKISTKENNFKNIIRENKLYAVMDAANDLNSSKFIGLLNKKNTSNVFISNVKKHLMKYDGKRRIASFLYDISEQEYKKFYKDNVDVDISKVPACGLALFSIVDDTADLYVIGNCAVSIVYKDGTVETLKDIKFLSVENDEIKEASSIAEKKHISFKSALKYIKDLQIRNRKLMNTSEGYQFLTPSQKPQFKFIHKNISLDIISKIYLYSSNFIQAMSNLKLYDNEFAVFEKNLDLSHILTDIIALLNKDKNYNNYPRINSQDDITIIKISFE
ncbi:MAG: hypothetical protein HUJ61_01845 [Bacilli bacterium]|nr:hypothetical protein [Bacilli bacterium]